MGTKLGTVIGARLTMSGAGGHRALGGTTFAGRAVWLSGAASKTLEFLATMAWVVPATSYTRADVESSTRLEPPP